MDKKIVFFDIDGTIYRFDVGIPKDTMESISKLKENGHIPVICTGRTRVMIYDEFLKPGFDYIVGGSGTYLEIDNKIEFLHEMKPEKIHEVCEFMISNGFSPVVEAKDCIYVEYSNDDRLPRGNEFVAGYRKYMGDKCKELDMSKMVVASKVSACFTTNSNMENIVNRYSDEFNIINHGNDLIELVPNNFTKATGIEALITKLDIPWENTYAFGDSFNDLEMLKYVRYGICMGNSDPELFKYTKYRTDDFDKGGITNALIEFGLIDKDEDK